ncbi:chromatin assembly factor 1 subunit A-like [Ptychodera flava]|uniref:chromatin assembly factor 1 subunit A-like n=1 Tax=Ptychodera flava TaxID=63121 RepID=UPI00396A55CD
MRAYDTEPSRQLRNFGILVVCCFCLVLSFLNFRAFFRPSVTMLGELLGDQRIESKKKITSSDSDGSGNMETLCSPPLKKLKQARLPFKPLDSCSPSPSNQASKKRKLSGSDKIIQSPKNAKLTKEPTSIAVCPKKTINEKLAFFKYQTSPESENEVSSSSETDKVKESVIMSKTVTTQPGSKIEKPRKLTMDNFVQKAQQPLVSTSEADSIDLTDNVDGNGFTNNSTVDSAESSDVGIQSKVPQESILKGETATNNQFEHEDYDKAIEAVVDRARSDSGDSSLNSSSNETVMKNEDRESETKEIIECSEDLKPSSNDRDDKSKENIVVEPSVVTVEGSPVKSQGNVADISTPKSKEPLRKKTPKSAKALAKERERLKKMEEREKERQEKKRLKEEALKEKMRVKEEARLAKEKEREEMRKQKEQEKEAKEKERREKKEKEEKERLEKQQIKEEERRRKQEAIDAKNEEKRQIEEEKKRVEEEKRKIEEEKLRKQQKLQNTFKGFFKKVETTCKPKETTTQGLFMPFQLKQDMVLAPKTRVEKSMDTCKENVDQFLTSQNVSSLYLDELRNGRINPGKAGKTKIQSKEERNDSVETMDTDEIQILEQAEDKSADKKTKKFEEEVHEMKAKLLQFHENYRPAYWGSCLKRSSKINPRNPFRKDEEIIDYEFDSDEEWEEPGETLNSNSEGEDENNEQMSDDSDDDGFFVPHGYLSEDEGCIEDDDMEAFRARRTAKAQSWEAELKRQCQPKLPIVLGCVWAGDELNSKQAESMKTLERFRVCSLVTVPIATSFTVKTSKQAEDETGSGNTGDIASSQRNTSSIKKPVPDDAMPDLIRLVHGNISGIKTLIKEFREYWKQKLNGGDKSKTGVDESVVAIQEEKPEDISQCQDASDDTTTTPNSRSSTPMMNEEYVISKRQLDLKINAIAVREKQANFKKVCWYVHANILEQYKLTDLPVPNQWQYVFKTPKGVSEMASREMDAAKISGRATPNIMQFTRPVSPSTLFERAKTSKDDDVIMTTTPAVKPILAAFKNVKAKPSLDLSIRSETDDKPEAMDVEDGYTADSDSDMEDCMIVDDLSASPEVKPIKAEESIPMIKPDSSTPGKSPRGQQTLLAMFKPASQHKVPVKPLSPTSSPKPNEGSQRVEIIDKPSHVTEEAVQTATHSVNQTDRIDTQPMVVLD